MDFFWEMLSLQETLFLLILLGVLVKKLKIIRENGRKTLSDLLIYAILPCNIVASFMGGITLPDGFVHNCILAVCISIGIQVLSIYGSKLLFRRYPANQKSVLSYGMICSNSSFVGLPIAHLMFGDLGVIYTSVFQIPLRFTMWTAGLSLFTDVSKKDAFRKLVRHPCIIAVFVGLILMVAPISLPNFLEEAIDITSGCTVPLSMIVIGTILADAPIRSLFSKSVLWYTCLRLVFFPVLIWLVLKPFPLDSTLVNVCILITGMPAGSTTSILADKYGGDAIFASQIIFASTLCSILTIPLLTFLMKMFPLSNSFRCILRPPFLSNTQYRNCGRIATLNEDYYQKVSIWETRISHTTLQNLKGGHRRCIRRHSMVKCGYHFSGRRCGR